jgi:hypothetical protein
MTKVKESAHIPRLVHKSLNGVMQFAAFNHLYTEPRIALWELKQRRQDASLKELVRRNLGESAARSTIPPSRDADTRDAPFRQARETDGA